MTAEDLQTNVEEVVEAVKRDPGKTPEELFPGTTTFHSFHFFLEAMKAGKIRSGENSKHEEVWFPKD